VGDITEGTVKVEGSFKLTDFGNNSTSEMLEAK